MCMHVQEVLFQIRSIKKPVTFFKMVVKKCNEKISLKSIILQKKLSASPKNGNPPIKI